MQTFLKHFLITLILCTKSKLYKKTEFLHLKHLKEFVEYIKTITCRYCNFYDETFYWQNETWQGDLTEEAKIRRESEARRKAIEQQQVAQTQAIINAYDRIRERRY